MGSSRFPGKPLQNIDGQSMLSRVISNFKDATLIQQVIVATCDTVIKDACVELGVDVILTSNSHQRASDRTSEATDIYERENNQVVDVVAMLQGDEPLITGPMIDAGIKPLLGIASNSAPRVTNLISKFASVDEWRNPNIIKVVCDKRDNALFMTRQAIPHGDTFVSRVGKQVCLICFERNYLSKYNCSEVGELEIAESIDMLRCLENGNAVRMVWVEQQTHPVDIPADIKIVESLLARSSND